MRTNVIATLEEMRLRSKLVAVAGSQAVPFQQGPQPTGTRTGRLDLEEKPQGADAGRLHVSNSTY